MGWDGMGWDGMSVVEREETCREDRDWGVRRRDVMGGTGELGWRELAVNPGDGRWKMKEHTARGYPGGRAPMCELPRLLHCRGEVTARC